MRVLRRDGRWAVLLALFAAVLSSTSPAADTQSSPSLEIRSVALAANRDVPELCVLLSESVGRHPNTSLPAYVAISPAAPLTVTARDRRLCLTGFVFGTDYTLTLKAGLPGTAHALAADWQTRFSVPNRPPEFDFVAPGRIVPRLGAETLYLRSVNVARLRIALFHVSDRDLVPLLDPLRPDGIKAPDRSVITWQGAIDIKADPDHEVSTPLAIGKTIPNLQPGLYAAVAEPLGDGFGDPNDKATTGYFVISDLGLVAYRTRDGLAVAVRSLATAAAAAGVDVALVGENNRELARARTDGSGYARFDPAVLNGTGGDRPRAIFAYGAAGEFSWLDLDAAGPQGEYPALRALVVPQRSDYRPGDDVSLTILLRDAQGHAPAKAPLTVEVFRPGSGLYEVRSIDEAGAGGYTASFQLPSSGSDGVWPIRIFADPAGMPIGDANIMVIDEPPARLSVSASIESALLDPAQPSTVDIRGQYAFGPPAGFVPGEMDVTTRPAGNPFPAFADFAFGLASEETSEATADPIRFTTDAAGKASQPVHVAAQPSATRPIEASVVAKILDLDGRAIVGATEGLVANQPLYLGLRPRGESNFPEGQAVHFDAVAVGPDGARVDKPDAGWEVRRLESVSDWSWVGNRWVDRQADRATRVAGGTISIPAGPPAAIEPTLPAGNYELEIFDPRSEAATSVRFRVGSGEGLNASGGVELKPAKPSYAPGEGADIFVKPPFEADVLLAAADRSLRTTMVQHVPAAGATMHLDVPHDANSALELSATAISASPSGLPRYANGNGRLELDPGGQRLDVKLDLPEKAQPGQPLPVAVTVAGAGDESTYAVVSAVDDAAISSNQLGDADPIDFFFPKRSPGANVLELLGGDLRVPPNATPSLLVVSFPDGTAHSRPLALYSGIVALDKTGKAVVPLDIPEFAGKLRITAMAWSASRTGVATAQSTIRRPLATTLNLPAFLTPDDHIDLDLVLDNVDGPRGEYRVTLAAEGQVALVGDTQIVANLAEHEERSQGISILAHAPGAGAILVSVQGPAGISFQRRFDLPVRDPGPATTRRAVATIKPEGQLAIDPSLLEGLRPDSVALSIAIGATPPIDKAAIERNLAESDFGPTEQLVSSATRLLTAGAPIPIGPVLARQRSDGGFGAWPTGGSEPWLSVYVMDFLSRAKAAGASVPEGAYRTGLDYVSRHSDPSPGGDAATGGPGQSTLETAAYANAVLARASRIDMAALRYFADRFLPQLRSPLAMAWIASGYAALGDKSTAAAIIDRAAAIGDAPAAGDAFASDLRDQAAFAATVADCGDEGATLAKTAQKIADLLASRRQLTAQEEAWLLRAAPAIAAPDDAIKLSVDGQTFPRKGVYVWTSQPGSAPKPPVIKNGSTKPLRAVITVSGAPANDPHEGSGYEIQRWFFDPQGKPIDPSTLKQNDLAVVVLTGRFTGQGDPSPIIIDPLPAGWTVEAAEIADPATRYPWLKDLTGAAQVSEDTRGLIAVPKLVGDRHEFKFAFVVRAAAKGQFALPPALIEDIARPPLFAHSTGGKTKIDPSS